MTIQTTFDTNVTHSVSITVGIAVTTVKKTFDTIDTVMITFPKG